MKTIHLPAAAQAAFQELGGFLKARPGRAKKRALQGVAIAIGVTTVLGAVGGPAAVVVGAGAFVGSSGSLASFGGMISGTLGTLATTAVAGAAEALAVKAFNASW